MSNYGSGTVPFAPFDPPVTPPSATPTEGDQFTVTMSADWWVLVAGACAALTADSSWDTTDFETLHDVRRWAYDVIKQIDARVPVINLTFQKKPGRLTQFQYRLHDADAWTDGPDNDAYFTPGFPTDSTSPSGYDLSVNNGLSQSAIPLLTAVDPNAVVKDPVTSADNVVTGIANVLLSLDVEGTATGVTIAAGADTIDSLLTLLVLI